MVILKYIYMSYGVIFTVICCVSFFRLVTKGGEPFSLLLSAIATWMIFVPLPYSALSFLRSIVFKK